MRKIILATVIATSVLPAASAFADPPPWAPAHGRRAHDLYNERGWYNNPRPLTRADRVWRGRDGRLYCRRENGTTGLVIGAAVGALLGNQLAHRGDRTLGTIVGAAGGALIGRAIDRRELRCR